MTLGKRWILKHQFDGVPKPEDFELVEEELPDLQDGEILVSALYLSLDPYMRTFTQGMTTPFTMIGEGVFKVVESKDDDFPPGSTILAKPGWVLTGILKSKELEKPGMITLAPPIGNLSPSLLLGACGMPGNTAYFGFTEICQPKEGETVVVTGAAGAVGGLVGQIAKIKGCRVLGFAGTDEKCHFLTQVLGFDAAYNYKTTKVEEALKDGAPNGVDCFFDNVGGVDAAKIINIGMNPFGRICCTGAISIYNDKELIQVPSTSQTFIGKQLKMEGHIATRWAPRWMEGINQMAKWIADGKIKTEETIVDGFENMPEAFRGLFVSTATTKGKLMIKA